MTYKGGPPGTTMPQFTHAGPGGVGVNPAEGPAVPAGKSFSSVAIEGLSDDYSGIFSQAWMLKVPELRKFIEGWIEKLQDPDYQIDPWLAEIEFEKELKATNWWNTHTEAWRTAEENRHTDQTTWDDNLETHKGDIQRLASSLGYPLDPAALDKLAWDSVHGGMFTNEELTREILSSGFQASDELPSGAVKDEYDSFAALAQGNLLHLGDSLTEELRGWAHKVKMGEMPSGQVRELIYDRAASTGSYAFLGEDRWDKWERTGTTLSNFLQPVRDTVAGIWELSSNQVDLESDWFKENLVVTDAKGGERLAKNRDIRIAAMADEKYLQTGAYKTKQADFMASMYKTFGVI